MDGRGGSSNYYAITHKPIDLDWTPGGTAYDALGPSSNLLHITRQELCDRLNPYETCTLKVYAFRLSSSSLVSDK